MTRRLLTTAFVGLFLFISPFIAFAEGIPLQKDVLLGSPILAPEDLPDEVTFTLYDSKTSTNPLGSQTYARGQYTVDFEFSKSDGISGGDVARVSAEFTNVLNLKDDQGDSIQPKEIWAALKVGGAEVGDRTRVSDETLVQLLLASDASIATYLTLVYEGDNNPFVTIYKDLPVSSLSSEDSASSLSNYFSAVAVGSSEEVIAPNSLTSPYWDQNGAKIYYNDGNVGVGTNSPGAPFHVSADSGVPLRVTRTSDGQSVLLWENTQKRWVMGMKNHSNGDSFFIQSRDTDNSNARTAIEVASGAANGAFYMDADGNVGLGTNSPGTYKLAVVGKIRCTELVVDTGWADFVFEDAYRLPSLGEVERHIKEKGHLPGIPTEAEVRQKGVNLGNISAKLLQKVEELTLYVIDLKRENEILKEKISKIEKAGDY